MMPQLDDDFARLCERHHISEFARDRFREILEEIECEMEGYDIPQIAENRPDTLDFAAAALEKAVQALVEADGRFREHDANWVRVVEADPQAIDDQEALSEAVNNLVPRLSALARAAKAGHLSRLPHRPPQIADWVRNGARTLAAFWVDELGKSYVVKFDPNPASISGAIEPTSGASRFISDCLQRFDTKLGFATVRTVMNEVRSERKANSGDT